ncbi:nectin-2 isoform X1 [Hemibagrus wyckioides]|uniref:nectin-2 isoform X1 n=1 Tax=Hemibagrus wyckioides TaxID=337641 RepID=UPI00266D3490|nr:nectin-2 isoform X1 [Hemibagrus wyckioides]XP_058244086.1 nectin-2 isoform X1 [Hemibagrus wyckioides]XP_058244094.1 nectin-2 isoform X1 [Hemibagrus wyckioides]XP_058244101.1 nectin-2 isoform X1 [Hemibagrus wyckioides]
MVRDSGFCSATGLLGAIILILLNVRGLLAQKVKVEPEVVSYPGQTVILRCQFPDPGQTQLTQVSWILEKSDGSRTNIAVFHPKYGANYPSSPVEGRVSFMIDPTTLENPTIQITEIALTDEGKYICEYAAYPTGNEKGVTSLIILAKPTNSATTITVPVGDTAVAVARCESANGRPPATITWLTSVNGNSSAPVTTDNSDNTVTVRSEYFLNPTPADNGKEITCKVTHRTMPNSETYAMKLVVQYPPQVQITGYDNNWYIGRSNVVLTCQYQGNPDPPTVNWKVSSGFMPDTVEVSKNRLTILKVDDAVNTTFICEVTNSLGTGKDQVAVFVREAPMPPSNAGVVAGAVIGSLLALLLVGALIAVLITRSRRQQQGYRGNSKGNSAPYDSVARLFGSSGSKNGTGNHGNNNAPIYKGDVGLSEKPGNIGLHQGGVALVENTPTAQDILLSSELDEAERRKFDELEDEDERYDQFSGSGPILQLRPHDEDPTPAYLDDDMESQRDGSIISRTAVYV